MYADFSVTESFSDFSSKSITIKTNFIVDDTTVTPETVKLFITENGKNNLISDYTLSSESKTIKIELLDYPDENDEYYIYVNGVRDRLGREFKYPYRQTISFSPNIATKLIIQAPENFAAIKSKRIHVETTILDDDNYTLKLIDEPSDIVIFSESDLKDMFDLGDNAVRLEVSTDNKFYKKEHILFGQHECESSNIYKVSADNVKRVGNTLSFDLILFSDKQYYIRARLESRENEHYFGEWSDCVTFIVKSKDPMDATEKYLEEMLFSDVLFDEGYEELKILSKTDDSYTDQEFFIEFNKPVRIEKNMPTTEDGLIYLCKGHLIRRDL